ncbi:MAG TPA: EF-P lysine aminoacylase EpmA [Rhabdochlamydiaceae bacterium]|nr:EF-P lysine aminoacylase EpmA [Rhabdochlamydiaceae bacterium]
MYQECDVHTSRLSMLRDRAEMLAKARFFFSERNVLEVDCPSLGKAAPIDVHIDVMEVDLGDHKQGYLHTSPEYWMKRLLAQGMGDIYQLSHVFRQGEIGRLHNPEFTMVEWYRLGIPFDLFIKETLDFICLFLGHLPYQTMTYREAIHNYADVDYLTAEPSELISIIEGKGFHLSEEVKKGTKDSLLQLLMSLIIEPHFGKDSLSVITDFPASQAALAKIIQGEEPIAKRFEVYSNGIELANGYHELADPNEQRRRLEESNKERIRLGKTSLKMDEHFLHALDQGLPDCCGVAVGFDRLMLLRHQKDSLEDVLPFPWSEA